MVDECRHYFSIALRVNFYLSVPYREVFAQAECQLWLAVILNVCAAIYFILFVYLLVLFLY